MLGALVLGLVAAWLGPASAQPTKLELQGIPLGMPCPKVSEVLRGRGFQPLPQQRCTVSSFERRAPDLREVVRVQYASERIVAVRYEARWIGSAAPSADEILGSLKEAYGAGVLAASNNASRPSVTMALYPKLQWHLYVWSAGPAELIEMHEKAALDRIPESQTGIPGQFVRALIGSDTGRPGRVLVVSLVDGDTLAPAASRAARERSGDAAKGSGRALDF